MKKSEYSDSQIIAILNQAEAGTLVSEFYQEHGMSSAIFYKWRSKCVGIDASMVARLKEQEEESRRMKRCMLRSVLKQRSSRKPYKKVESSLD